jgi:tRNA/rRNA methyltransferase
MYTVIFVEPESSGNIGALARVMKNFGLSKLILVNPKCEINQETRARAKHAFEIIEKARTVKSIPDEFDFLIGTTGKTTLAYNETRSAIAPDTLAEQMTTRGKIAIIFGREGRGLTNEELELCDIVVNIPADKRYPILNITHAAAIVFYELFSKEKKSVREARKKEKEVLFDYFDEITGGLDGLRDKKKISKIFRNVINRSLIAGKEAHTIAGAFNEMKKKLSR